MSWKDFLKMRDLKKARKKAERQLKVQLRIELAKLGITQDSTDDEIIRTLATKILSIDGQVKLLMEERQ